MKVHTVGRRSLIRLLSFFLAALAVLGGFLCRSQWENGVLRRRLDAVHMRAFAELTGNVTELDTALQKLLYAASPGMISALCANIYGKANAAQTALAELPFDEMENASSFLARTGDYAYALARSAESHGALSAEEHQNLEKLSAAAAALSDDLIELLSELEDGRLPPEAIGRAMDGTPAPAGERFQEMEREFPELPTLIYDGPFSQHIETASPKLLEGEAEVSCEQALEAAAAFCGLEPDAFPVCREAEGRLPQYGFAAGDGSRSVNVTRVGGKICSMSVYRAVGPAALSAEEAVETARRFLAERGFGDMKESYWTRYDRTLLINFAAVQEECVCYPDLIKVSVALDDGEILGFEAAGYLANHHQRELPPVEVGEEVARHKVSPYLEILSHTLCLIPTAGQNEIFCHEFKCENDRGEHYIVYINAQDGREEKLLCLIESENGTLTM